MEKLEQILADLKKALAGSEQAKQDTISYMIGIAIAQVEYEIEEARKRQTSRH